MKRTNFACLVVTTALAVLFTSGCDKLRSRDQLNQGVVAFKNAKFADAVEHFKTAIQLDPTNSNGKLYLATSYMSQWIPGADSPENKQLAASAKDEFLDVLKDAPGDKTALASLASIAYNQAQAMSAEEKAKKFDEAAEWYKKLIAVDPNNKEAYYSLGVIAWAKWYPALMTARAKLGMKPEAPGPIKDQKVKEELKAQYLPMIDEGIQNLHKALDIDKEYDDAMAYLNLLIREKADLADNPDEYKKQTEIADNWVQKALDTKKLKASRVPSGATGINNGTSR
ncbi:MAG: tetratricopeptide repeat protein [Bryobacteraceae bacterium]